MTEWTKKGLLMFALIICFLFTAGCAQNSAPTGLSLTGTVKHDNYDFYMGSWYSSVSMDEYVVNIDVMNWGGQVTYDAVQIYYDGGDGRGLSTTVVHEFEEKPMEKTLGFWGTDNLISETNGYTIDVLKHTKTGRVALHVTFIKGGEAVDSFHAVLPSIIMWDNGPAELPLWKEVPLHFTRDYDAVMREVQNR